MIVSVSEKKCTLKYISVGKNEIQYPVDAFHKRAKSTSWKIFIYILYTHTHANHYFFDYLTKMKWNKIKYKIKKKKSCDLVIQNQNLEVYHNHTYIYIQRNEMRDRQKRKNIPRSSLFRRVHIYFPNFNDRKYECYSYL